MWLIPAYAAAKTILGTNSDIKVAKSQNKAAMSQLGKQINEISLQRAQSLQQTSTALYNIDLARDQAVSQVQLQSGASGTLGASVKDAVSTVNASADAQVANAYTQQSAQLTAYRLATQSAVDSTHNQMDWESGTDKLWNNMLSGFGSMVGSAVAGSLASGGGSTQAGISASPGTYDTQASSTPSVSNSYNYDLWGRQSGGTQSVQTWKSYLNK